MMIYHAIGREEKLKFPLHLFLGITCTRRKKPITLFYEYLKFPLHCTYMYLNIKFDFLKSFSMLKLIDVHVIEIFIMNYQHLNKKKIMTDIKE